MSNKRSRKNVRDVVGIKAVNSNILIELLEPHEIFNTPIEILQTTKVEAPQAYILDIGPSLDKSKCGFDVGDRIILSGGFVPCPKKEGERQKGIIDLHAVKAVLVEGNQEQKPKSALAIA